MFKLMVRRKFLLRIIIAFSLLMTGAVLVLALAFARLYSEVLHDAVTAEHRERLTHMGVGLERLHQDVINGYLSLTASPSLQRFLHASEPVPVDELAVRRLIRQYLYLRSELHSITVYSRSTDFFISTAFRNETSEADTERQFLAGVHESLVVQPRSVLVNRPTLAPAPDDVVTYAFRVPLRGGEGRSDMVVINVHDPLRQAAVDAFERSEPVFLLSAPDGTLLSPRESPHRHEPVVQAILAHSERAAPASSGTFVVSVDDQPVTVSYLLGRSPADFILASVHDTLEVTQTVRERRNTIVRIAVIVFGGGALTLVFLAHVVYRPVSRKVDRIIRQLSRREPFRGDRTDLDSVLESFSQTIREMRVLEELNRTHVERIRTDYLQQMITDPGHAIPIDGSISQADGASSLRVCVCAIDEHFRAKPTGRAYADQWLLAAAAEHARDCAQIDVIPAEEGMVAVVYWQDPDQDSLHTAGYWEPLQLGCRQELNHTLTVGVGPRVSGLEHARESYLVARACLESRFVRGPGRVCAPQTMTRDSAEVRPYPDYLEQRLVQAVRAGSPRELKDGLAQLNEYIKPCRPDNARQICESVYYACARLLLGFAPKSSDARMPISERFREIDSFASFASALQWIREQFRLRSQQLSTARDADEADRLVEEVSARVRNDYAEVNLAVETLAHEFGYSPNYFGRVFKRASGVALSDLIRQVRLARAKELLAQTDVPVHEIAGRVGFANEKYFYYAFRRSEGLTPQMYRLRSDTRTRS